MFASAALIDEMSVLWFQAPMVIATRMQDLVVAGFSGRQSAPVELSRMVTEKLAAASESLVAVNVALVSEAMTLVSALATGTYAGLAASTDRLAVAALKPYGKRVRANARRLSK